MIDETIDVIFNGQCINIKYAVLNISPFFKTKLVSWMRDENNKIILNDITNTNGDLYEPRIFILYIALLSKKIDCVPFCYLKNNIDTLADYFCHDGFIVNKKFSDNFLEFLLPHELSIIINVYCEETLGGQGAFRRNHNKNRNMRQSRLAKFLNVHPKLAELIWFRYFPWKFVPIQHHTTMKKCVTINDLKLFEENKITFLKNVSEIQIK